MLNGKPVMLILSPRCLLASFVLLLLCIIIDEVIERVEHSQEQECQHQVILAARTHCNLGVEKRFLAAFIP